MNEDGVDPLPPLPDDVALPIVFVHGFAGSAQQFESQAIRFAANGYPQDRIVAYDHDGAGFDVPGYTSGLDEVVDATLADFDVEQVYLVGHSRGTGVSSSYLGDPGRAAKVARYVALDGAACPTVVPCVAITQASNPGQAHVEVATSKESFAALYEFLVGDPPEVVDIVPQRQPVELAGRAVNFPANTGREGATLDVWEIDADTGARVAGEPHASFVLGPDGDFGPFTAGHGAHYEYVLSTPDSDVQHHLYLQPYLRSSQLVRLLSSPPDGPTRANTNVGDGHSAIIAMRMREWYANDRADVAGDQRDILEISTSGPDIDQEPVNAITGFMGNGAIGLHFHDDAATPGETTLEALPYFSQQPFQSGADVLMPASASADEPDGTITITNIPRGEADRPQTLNVPNWPSSGHAISVVFTDYPVDAPSPRLVLDPATNHLDGQSVHVGGGNVPDTYAGPPFWVFPTTGDWVAVQCGAAVEDAPTLVSFFTNCAAGDGAVAVEVRDGVVDTDIVVSSAITSILGDDIDCTVEDACVVALARLESGGEVTVLTAPLSFVAGSP